MISWGQPLDRPENRVGVRLLGWTNLAFTHLYHHVSVRRPSCLPLRGPAILICNHVGGIDPLFLQASVSRLIIWMMAREYYEKKSLNWIFRTIEAISVERSGRDFAATRAGLRALERGRVLGIFPEGRISGAREMLPFHTGVALMAIKANVPVYPAYIDGTHRGKEMNEAFAKPHTAVVTFGPPVAFDRSSVTRSVLTEATGKMRDAINILAASTGRGV